MQNFPKSMEVQEEAISEFLAESETETIMQQVLSINVGGW